MDARITVAQTTGSLPNSESPKVIKLTKPQTDQAITIHLDGATKLDLTAPLEALGAIILVAGGLFSLRWFRLLP